MASIFNLVLPGNAEKAFSRRQWICAGQVFWDLDNGFLKLMEQIMRIFLLLLTPVLLFMGPLFPGDGDKKKEGAYPLFQYLCQSTPSRMISYAPSGLDPRFEANQLKLPTSSIRADLEKLRPYFDGFILYGYHEACTPRILAVAKDLKFRAVILSIWQPKSSAEIDGVAALVNQYEKDMALGVIIGNEGITFKRYEPEDLTIALARLRTKIPRNIPIGTSETYQGSKMVFVQKFGDFMAPNIHPYFDLSGAGPQKSVAWARQEAMKLAVRSGKPVILKETGFPHGGKEGYNPQTQKEFWAEYFKLPTLEKVKNNPRAWVYHGVAFDAFDLPWKVQASGLSVEKEWGLFNQDRQAYPALASFPRLRVEDSEKKGSRK